MGADDSSEVGAARGEPTPRRRLIIPGQQAPTPAVRVTVAVTDPVLPGAIVQVPVTALPQVDSQEQLQAVIGQLHDGVKATCGHDAWLLVLLNGEDDRIEVMNRDGDIYRQVAGWAARVTMIDAVHHIEALCSYIEEQEGHLGDMGTEARAWADRTKAALDADRAGHGVPAP